MANIVWKGVYTQVIAISTFSLGQLKKMTKGPGGSGKLKGKKSKHSFPLTLLQVDHINGDQL